MHSPEQAKELWCPMGRAAGAPVTTNDPVVPHQRIDCIADRCAMWRWRADPKMIPFGSQKLGVGFCGIAGRPEVAA
jgi:hypothetical protein